MQTRMEPTWTVARVRLGPRLQFRIAVGTEATPANDPVAMAYRAGSAAHLAPLLRVARALLRPGDRVLDLGAHLGGFALSAAALGCAVIAAEASPRNAQLLRRSVDLNQFGSLQVVQAAVAERNGSIDFSCHGPWGHVATPATGMPSITVPAVRVDDLLAERGWDRVTLIKLDVEGSEIAALRGMPRLLSGEDAPAILFESNRHTLGFYGRTHQELKAELREQGYAIHTCTPMGLQLAGDEQVETVCDYVAAKQPLPSLSTWSGRARTWLHRLLS